MRIDSHQHFWKIARGDYGWMSPDLGVLYRDYLPEHLLPHLNAHRIDGTIVVQAAPTVAETDFLLELAACHDRIAGVVGWFDVESADFAALCERYRAMPGFVGIRPMLQDLPEDDWITRPHVLDNIEALIEYDLTFDFLTFSRHLPFVLRVLERFPKLRAVIDHISKPEIKAQRMHPWKELMREAAAHPNLYCKVSGMITEADHRAWTADHLRPYVDHVLDCFGADRLMFGSDWPVCLLAGTYDRVIGTLEELLADLDPISKEKVFGLNAARFYLGATDQGSG